MDFDKLISQRAKKAAALSPEAGERILAAKEKIIAEVEAEKKTRNRPKDPESKKSSWKLKGFYLRPETAKRLKAYVNRQQEDDQKIDASDVVEQALSQYLDSLNA